ncbi:MAG: hypothetical protein ACXAEU_17155 [Candidatus Hodarchaeales archaeon]|jgi:hypothetical protein
MTQVYGDGFGVEVTGPDVANEDTGEYRRERTIRTVVGNDVVTVIVRDTIVPEDPFLNMIRAAAYTWQQGRGSPRVWFPVPPIGRDIKDALIKINLTV